MARKHDHTGRNRFGPPFVMLEHYMLESEAWRALSLSARAVFIHVRKRFMGANNGRIPMSVRELADECSINKNTAGKALQELQAKGFLKVARRGAFRQRARQSTEWILTIERYDDELPTKDFMRWQPGKDFPVPFFHLYGPKNSDRVSEKIGLRVVSSV